MEELKRGADAWPRDLERLCERLWGDGDLDLETGVEVTGKGEEGIRFLGFCFRDVDLEIRTQLLGF